MANNTAILPDTLSAARHPPEYRLHKYWARKPHNVAAAFLRALVPPGGAVLDPFCGSGVILAEARALGLQATGIDLNPAAALIADVTTNPPPPEAFAIALDALLDWSCEVLAPFYALPDGETVRYCVHAGLVICPDCGRQVSAWEVRDQGRRRRCPACGAALRFNLATITGTRIIEVVTTTGERRWDPPTLRHQQTTAYRFFEADLLPDAPLLPNRRILAWDGMRVADLFTPRNYHMASLLTRYIQDVQSGTPTPITRALHALLSATLAGFSRLVAYRDGLRGGGPAWSVPGFWVAPVHVEHNPLPLLQAWGRRYRRGIRHLWARLDGGPPAAVITGAAQDVLPDLARQGAAFDLIVLDPPYGDSVPYLEFSALWNAFLGETPDYEREIVVSDRTVRRSGWDSYTTRLAESVRQCVRVLKPTGAVLITFNNLNGRAWAALLAALHGAGLRCEAAHYVAPAVISAKAQFAPDGSYHGDFWCIFRRGPLPDVPRSRWADVWQAAIPDTVSDPQRRRRLALRAILTANLPAEAVLALREVEKSSE